MANIECGKGHIYDSDLYDSCPYCNGGGKEIRFETVGGSSGGTSSGGRMETVGGFGSGGYDSPSMRTSIGKTEAAGYSTAGAEKHETVAPGSYNRRNDKNKTVAIVQARMNIQPVVGWLVCIEGPDMGKDYRLYDKQNTIGRSERMDVFIEHDKTVSRDNHARLAYDSRHRVFTLIPAESTNNIYLNDEPVYAPIKISAYDCVEFGQSKFLFVPFCGSRFNWEDGLMSGEADNFNF